MIMGKISAFTTKQRAKQLCTECLIIEGFYERLMSAFFYLGIEVAPNKLYVVTETGYLVTTKLRV